MTTTLDTPTTAGPVARAAAIAAEIRPGATAADLSGELRADVYAMLTDAGITAALVPSDFGGAGASHAEMGDIIAVLAAADPAVGLTLSMHSHLVAAQVWRHNNGLDASAVFEKVVGGAVLISTGASDWLESSGTVTPVDGGYRVSARKAPSSGCEIGTVAATSIRWDDHPDGPQVIHCSIPFAAEGVSIEKTWDTTGMRATGSHTIVFDEVFVPEAAVALTRPADVWHPVWSTVLGAAMPLIMATYRGIADAAVEIAVETARTRGNGSPSLVGELVNAHTTVVDTVDAMFAMSENLTFANTDEYAARVLARKSVAASAAIETVRLAIEVVGGSAYGARSELARLHRDVHGALFHPLPRARQLELTGRVALGRSPV